MNDAVPPRVTIRTLAERLGVSTFTVSAALNGSPRVKASTRERVVAEAKRSGYKRNAPAYLLIQQRHRRVATDRQIRIGYLQDRLHPDVSQEARTQLADENGYELVELDFPPLERLPVATKQWWSQGIEGLIINVRGSRLHVLEYVEEAVAAGFEFDRFSVVTVGRSVFSHIYDDPPMMMREAIQQTLEKGYRRLCVLLGTTDHREEDEARLGTVLVAREQLPAGCSIMYGTYPSQPMDGKAAARALRRMLRQRRIDAVIAFPGGVSWALLDEGFVWPRDFAFCGLPIAPRPDHEDLAGLRDAVEFSWQTVLEIMSQTLSLGIRGIPPYPHIRYQSSVWQDGPSMPTASERKQMFVRV